MPPVARDVLDSLANAVDALQQEQSAGVRVSPDDLLKQIKEYDDAFSSITVYQLRRAITAVGKRKRDQAGEAAASSNVRSTRSATASSNVASTNSASSTAGASISTCTAAQLAAFDDANSWNINSNTPTPSLVYDAMTVDYDAWWHRLGRHGFSPGHSYATWDEQEHHMKTGRDRRHSV